MVNNILLEVLGTIAEQERVTIKHRQSKGIAATHLRGIRFGRARIRELLDWDSVIADMRDSVIADMRDGMIIAMRAMKLAGMKRTSFY